MPEHCQPVEYEGVVLESPGCLILDIGQPIQLNQSVPVTLTIETQEDYAQLLVSLDAQYSVVIEGEHQWELATQAHTPVQLTSTVRFTAEGWVMIVGRGLDGAGQRREFSGSHNLHITALGGTVDPPPATSAPLTGTVIFSTPEPPTPDSATTPAPGAALMPATGWVTLASTDFESNWPNSSWSISDESNDGYDRKWSRTVYRHHSGSWAAWPARGGQHGRIPSATNDDYFDDMNTVMKVGPMDLREATLAEVRFWLWRELEPGRYDYLTLEVATRSSGPFTEVAWWDTTDTTWQEVAVPLNAY